MQLFVYYVFWPFVGTSGAMYLGLMDPGTEWVFFIGWFLPWVFWPVGRYRRRYARSLVAAFETEVEEGVHPGALQGFAIGMGPTILMILSGMIGTIVTPTYMEEVMGIDVQAKIEELKPDAG